MKPGTVASDISRYKIVPHGSFAYNPMRLNIGSIAMWPGEEDVLVSPDYVVFHCDLTRLDPDYLNHLRQSHAWHSFVARSGNGSVRVRIYYSDLATMKVVLPPLVEQQRIAKVLNTCDRELEVLHELVDSLKVQKRGLMQKLLTGHIRVRTG